MSHTLIKTPGEDHPIAITPNPSRVVVRVRGETVAETVRALTVSEASLAAIHYIPREDIKMNFLESVAHVSYCPYKGTASYFDLVVAGARHVRAAWSYEAPHDALWEISELVAFMTGQAACVEEWERSDGKA